VRGGGDAERPRLILPPEAPATAARLLALAGWEPVCGPGRSDDLRAVWNAPPRAAGEIGLEPLFLGHPDRLAGLRVDPGGEARLGPSLSRLLDEPPLDDTAALDRARDAVARMRHWGLVTAPQPPAPPDAPPQPGHVLVLDQPAGEAPRADLLEALFLAKEDHPQQRILVLRPPGGGQIRDEDLGAGAARVAGAPPLHDLLDGAIAVYTVSAPLGFDAILSGHRPVVLGQPFYAGRGLTDDRGPVTRHRPALTRAQLFAAAMILAPLWYDPHRDALATIEDAISAEAALVRAARDDGAGYVAAGMRRWKHRHMTRMLGGDVRFARTAREAPRSPGGSGGRSSSGVRPRRRKARRSCARRTGSSARPGSARGSCRRCRSRSTTSGSTTTQLRRKPARTPDRRLGRPAACRNPTGGGADARIRAAGVTKYNIRGPEDPELPDGAILVAGQVETDASILSGAGDVRTNLALLQAVRAANPGATVLYKPHPDVEAGLRPGRVPEAELRALADGIMTGDPARLLRPGVTVWTITSLLGFEALLRGVPVTTLGAPFYAGWGLTRDFGSVPARRTARPPLAGLAHAALIGYPRYFDPKSGLPCPPEVAVERLATGEGWTEGGLLAALQALRGRLMRS
jgi:capsular polysaccharide export protein